MRFSVLKTKLHFKKKDMKKTQTETSECVLFCLFHILFLFFSLHLSVTLFYILKFCLNFLFFLCFWVSFKLFENGGKMNKPFKKKIPNKNSKYKFRKKRDYPIADCSFTLIHLTISVDYLFSLSHFFCHHSLGLQRGSTKTLNHLQSMHIIIICIPVNTILPKNFGIDAEKIQQNRALEREREKMERIDLESQIF